MARSPGLAGRLSSRERGRVNPDLHQRAKSIFLDACDLAPPERERFLNEQCAGDTELRAAADALLESDANPLSLGGGAGIRAQLEGLVAGTEIGAGTANAALPPDPERIGCYRIIRKLGEGGFGYVYEAQQTEPLHRTVALKVIKPGMDTRQVIARFEAERQSLAMMDHPNIARVFEAGATENGRPYFVMELVAGPPITEYCDARSLDLKARLDLFAAVCHAVQHAHQKGIIHRDIKPSNVMVTLQDGKARPVVIDFGIARALGDDRDTMSLVTQQGQMIGTPEYMSPEQAGADPDIDTRTDIYSLGVLLYELLTGSTPIERASLCGVGLMDFQGIIREQEPPTPSTRVKTLGAKAPMVARGRRTDPAALHRMLRGDLDWIAMKALEKDRSRRYETVNGLAMDIQRFLKDEPVIARPPTASYRLRKFARRNKGPLAAGVAMLVLLIGGSVGTTIGMVRSRAAESRARTEADVARAVNEFLNDDLLAAAAPEAQGRDVLMREVLAIAAERIEGRFAEQPLVESAVRLTLGKTYGSLGEYGHAERHLERARSLRVDMLGNDDPATHEAAEELATLRILQGRYDEAEAIFADSRARLSRLLGEDHLATARAVHGIGRVHIVRGRYQEAAIVFADSLRRFQRIAGPRDAHTLEAMTSLAAAYRLLDRPAEAEALYTESLDANRTQFGPEHPSTLSAMNDLAICYQSLGRYPEAVKTFEQVVAARRRVLGEEHPDTVNSTDGLANLYYELGKLEEAEAMFVRTLYALRHALGDDHPRTLTCANGLARVYHRQKRHDEAERLCADSLDIVRRRFGEENTRTITAMATLAQIYQSQGRLADAEPLFTKVLGLRRKVFGDKHRDTLTALHNLAFLYQQQGRIEEAEPLLALAVAGGRESLPPGHSFLGAYLTTHGITLKKLSRFEMAEQALLEAHAILTTALGPQHQRTVKTTEEIVMLYEAWAKPDEAAFWRAKLDRRE